MPVEAIFVVYAKRHGESLCLSINKQKYACTLHIKTHKTWQMKTKRNFKQQSTGYHISVEVRDYIKY